MNVALKEANETEYWLMLLKDTGFISTKEFDSIKTDCAEILRLLISIVKSTNIVKSTKASLKYSKEYKSIA
jgi:four helix bundle protein